MALKQPKRKPRPGVDEYGRTPLHNALVPLGGDVDVKAVNDLLKNGADPNAQDDNGFSALHFAAQESLQDVTILLLRAGADPNLRDVHGNSPLFRALMNGHSFAVVKSLVEAGADPFKENNHGVSAVELALNSQAVDPAKNNFILSSADLFRQLEKMRNETKSGP